MSRDLNKNILDLTKKLISIPSTKENPESLKGVLKVAKNELAGFEYKEFESNSIPSLLFYNTPELPEKFKIILNAHLDVVPAKEDYYSITEKDGKLYGRGTDDMKAAGAVEILVFKELAKNLDYPIGLQLVTDEEVSGYHGTGHQIREGIKADFVLAGEPTNFGVNNKAKGIIWLKIKSKGQTGHGAYPWNGDNAIWKMKQFLDKLQENFSTPSSEAWVTTVNLAKIETSNSTFNKIPDDCEVSLDIRYIPEDKETILNKIKSMLPEGLEIEVLENEPAQSADENSQFIKSLRNSVKKVTGKESEVIVKHGASDIRFYDQVGIPGVTFGPIGAGLHSDEEWVDIKSLSDYYEILKDFLLELK